MYNVDQVPYLWFERINNPNWQIDKYPINEKQCGGWGHGYDFPRTVDRVVHYINQRLTTHSHLYEQMERGI